MATDAPGSDGAVRIRREADNVLKDQAFQRSPTLSRLLGYLVDMTVQGKGKSVKSYTIAMDGLGKDADSAEEIDTYARVVVTRLRKALDVYYAGRNDAERLYIPSGSYEVMLTGARPETQPNRGEAADAPCPSPAEEPGRAGRWRGKWPGRRGGVFVLALIAGAAIALAAFLAVGQGERGDASRWAQGGFPTVKVLVESGDDTPEGTRLAEAQRHALHVAMNNYIGVRVLDSKAARADFAVRIFGFRQEGGMSEAISLIDAKSNQVIWSTLLPLDASAVEENADSVAFNIASISGAINAYLRRRGYDVQTPHGCWLRFTEGVQTYNTVGDRQLEQCAADFYENRPTNRVATMLYGWTLIDQSLVQRTEEQRRARLDKAQKVLQRGLLLNPDTSVLQVTAMRAYSFAMDRERAVQAANDALDNAGGNRTIIGMAGFMLVLWNDPAGERVLAALDRKNRPPLPWEHVGLFIAAMMRDDTAATGVEWNYLKGFEQDQPLLLILNAAHLSRTGRFAEAEEALGRLRANPRMFIAGTDKVIERMPMAPEVKERLRGWLNRRP